MDKYDQVEDVSFNAKVKRIWRAILPVIRERGTEKLQHLTVAHRWNISASDFGEALKRVQLLYCRVADRDCHEHMKWHAHTGHIVHTVCVSRALNEMRDETIISILLHELGHLFGGDEDVVANEWAEVMTRVSLDFHEGASIQPVKPYELGFTSEQWAQAIANEPEGLGYETGIAV